MNRIFKVVKSRTGNDIAVSELASSKGGARCLSAALILVSGLCTGNVMAEEDNDVITETVEISGKYTNNGTIKVESTEENSSGNAIEIVADAASITNNGVISGNINIDKTGKDLVTIDITTLGVNADVQNSANGIFIGDNDHNITITENSGIILGNAILTGGTGNRSFEGAGQPKYIYTKANANNSANGIFNSVASEAESIVNVTNNSGIISGNAILKGGEATSTLIKAEEYSPNSDSSVNAKNSANGIFNSVASEAESIVNVTNNSGIISGNATLKGGESTSSKSGNSNLTKFKPANATTDARTLKSANGILNSDIGKLNRNVTITDNSGMISGNATLEAGNAINDISHFTPPQGVSTAYNGAQARVVAESSANGIASIDEAEYGSQNSLEVTNNSGIISGNVTLKGGKATVGGLEEGSIATAEALRSANGIMNGYLRAFSFWDNSSYVTIKENSGVISGNATLQGGEVTLFNGEVLLSSTLDASAIAQFSANGIFIDDTDNHNYEEVDKSFSSVEVTNNSGIISGNATLQGGKVIDARSDSRVRIQITIDNSANGIFNDIGYSSDQFNVIVNDNRGIISGYALLTAGTEIVNGIEETSYTQSSSSGNGIYSSSSVDVNNTGLIKGYSYSTISSTKTTVDTSSASGYAIYATTGTINNYGILAAGYDSDLEPEDNKGNGAVVGGAVNTDATYKDYGINVFVDKDGNVVSAKTMGTTGNNSGYKIINAEISDVVAVNSTPATKDSSHTFNGDLDKTIINGVGTETGALTVNTKGTITDSIVNGYNTALTVNNGGDLTATNTIFNGGGYNGEVAVIDVTSGGKLVLEGTSVINGNTTVSGASELTLGNSAQLNGNISGDKTGTLNLGDGSTIWADDAGYGAGALNTNGNSISHEKDVHSGDLKIYQNISGFKQINVDGRVTTYEIAKISDVTNINIGDGAQLVVRVNPLVDGQYTGTTNNHALYSIGGTVIADIDESLPNEDYSYNPQLVFKTNGMKIGDTIEMGTTDISGLKDAQIDTWSIITTAKKKGDGNVILAENDFDDIFFPDGDDDDDDDDDNGGVWEDIYDSIKNADELDALSPTGDAEDSEENRRKGLLSLLDQIYANNPYNQSAMLAFKNVTTLRNQILDTKMPKLNEWIAEAHVNYAQSQHTKDRDITLGNTSIADKYKTDLSNYSALITAEHGYKQDKSLGFALGMAHSKAKMSHNTKLDGNSFYLGLYNKHKVDNFEFVLGTGFSFGTYDGTRTISNQYQSVTNNGKVQTATFDFYGQAKYRYALNESTFLEPKVRLSDVIVRQSSVNEDSGALAIEQDTKMYHVPAFAIGMDLAKRFDLSDSVLKAKVGILGERTFGHWDNLVDARIQNSTDFVTQGAQFQRSSVDLTLSAEHELTQKLYYKATVNYGIAQREKDNLGVGLTVGYTF